MSSQPPSRIRNRLHGFTLIEVLVALVIVAFGMGAMLAALSGSASNVAALRDKTLAQWVALNCIADVRLSLKPPQTGTIEGDVKGFGNADWHWQQIISNVQEIPGLLQITVKVRRTATDTAKSGSTGNPVSTVNSTSITLGGKEPDWTTTVIGFRSTSIAAASGEVPDWSGGTAVAGSSSGSSSGGNIANPGTTPGSSSTSLTPSPSGSGSSSSGGS
jgi:general secretion pathway protein I